MFGADVASLTSFFPISSCALQYCQHTEQMPERIWLDLFPCSLVAKLVS